MVDWPKARGSWFPPIFVFSLPCNFLRFFTFQIDGFNTTCDPHHALGIAEGA
jgi:hypothetical protein